MPWIFICLMLANAVYFGWKFMEGPQHEVQSSAASVVQVGARVQLLKERPDLIPAPKPPAVPVAAAEDVTAAPVEVAPALQCFDVGPFAADADMQRFAGTMKARHFHARSDNRKVDGKDYWVFIPAFTTRAKAEARLRDLKVRGVQGFVVKDGMFVNAISLNHFSRKELAQAYLEKMQAMGVAVEYREITRNETEFWIYLSPGQARTDLRDAIDAQIGNNDSLRREGAPCEE